MCAMCGLWLIMTHCLPFPAVTLCRCRARYIHVPPPWCYNQVHPSHVICLLLSILHVVCLLLYDQVCLLLYYQVLHAVEPTTSFYTARPKFTSIVLSPSCMTSVQVCLLQYSRSNSETFVLYFFLSCRTWSITGSSLSVALSSHHAISSRSLFSRSALRR